MVVQVRLAEIAADVEVESPSIIAMLVDMLSSKDEDVVEATVDSLNSIVQQSPSRIANIQLEPLLSAVNPRDAVVARVLESLRRRVGQL